jgi:hypothetical protein
MPERPSLLPFIGLAVFSSVLSSFAFTRGVRNQILQRDKGCQGTGEHGGILEAAHIDHNHKASWYNLASNGIALCTLHHLFQHQDTPLVDLGMCKESNDWAIDKLEDRVRLLEDV